MLTGRCLWEAAEMWDGPCPSHKSTAGHCPVFPGLESKSDVHRGSQVPAHWAECWAATLTRGLAFPLTPSSGASLVMGAPDQASVSPCVPVCMYVHVCVCVHCRRRGAGPFPENPSLASSWAMCSRTEAWGGQCCPPPVPRGFGAPRRTGHREASRPLKRSVFSLLSVSGGDVLVTPVVPGGRGEACSLRGDLC